MKNETKTKLAAWAVGVLTLPTLIGLMAMLTYARKITSDFWAGLFF